MAEVDPWELYRKLVHKYVKAVRGAGKKVKSKKKKAKKEKAGK